MDNIWIKLINLEVIQINQHLKENLNFSPTAKIRP